MKVLLDVPTPLGLNKPGQGCYDEFLYQLREKGQELDGRVTMWRWL